MGSFTDAVAFDEQRPVLPPVALTQTERKRQDRFCLPRWITSLLGPDNAACESIHPQSSVPPTADEA